MNTLSDLKNYYEVLEIPVHAKPEEIYHCYQRAKTAYSSDSIALYSLMSSDECRNVLELIEEAYSILSDPIKRKRYDEARGLNRDFNTLMNYDSNPSERTLSSYLETATNSSNKTSSNISISSITSTARGETHSNDFTLNSISRGSDHPASGQMGATGTTNVTKLVTQKRFALDYILNADFEKEIDEATEFTGDFLRKIREYKNLDLERLSDMIKVSRLYIQGIEAEDFSKLPAAVYVRGFVFQYAKCLKLKPDVVANAYIARMKKLKP